MCAAPCTKRNEDAEVNDLYISPPEAMVAMKQLVPRGNRLLDPCNGLADMSNYFKSEGHRVYTGDLYDYGVGTQYIGDFLKMEKMHFPSDIDTIIMNPPYLLTLEFIDHALELCDHLVMFNRMSVLEGQARGRRYTSGDWPLKRCNIFSYRVSCTKGINREKTNNAVAYAVYEFDKNYTGEPTLGWVTK